MKASAGGSPVYPVVQLMTLVETGTRAADRRGVSGRWPGRPITPRQLLHLLTPDMLVLADRGLDAAVFLADVAAAGCAVRGPADL